MQSGLAPFLLLLSVGVIITQTILGDADWHVLWLNWLAAGIIGWGTWDCIDRFRMGRSSDQSLMIVEWVFVAGVLNIGTLCFTISIEPWRLLLVVLGFWLILRLLMGSWQDRTATVRNLLCGLIIGLLSVYFPHILEWLLLLPFAAYFMRSLNLRNALSALTGVAVGIWIDYCVLHFFGQPGANQALFNSYLLLADIQGFDIFSLGIWQWSIIGLTVALLLIYTILGFFLNSGGSLRSHTTVVMYSVLALILVVLLMLDLPNLMLYLVLASLIVSVQMLLVLANSRSVSAEWWAVFILLAVLTLGILPVCL